MPFAPGRLSSKKKRLMTAPPMMPDENRAVEVRLAEENEDRQAIVNEEEQVVNQELKRQRRERLDKIVQQRLKRHVAGLEAIAQRIQDLNYQLRMTLRDAKLAVKQDIQANELEEHILLESFWTNSRQRKSANDLGTRAEHIRSSLASVSQEINRLWSERRAVTKILQKQLKRLLEHDKYIKQHGPHQNHRNICAAFADGSIAISKHLTKSSVRKMELDRLKSGMWSPTSSITGQKLTVDDAVKWHNWGALLSDSAELDSDRTANALRQFSRLCFEFNPVGQDPARRSQSLLHPISALGHAIRAVEFDCTRYRIFPGIAFARTWATLALTRFCSLWDFDRIDLKCWVKMEKANPFSRRYYHLLVEVSNFIYRVEDLLLDYKFLINEGDTLLCPHKQRDFHEWHCRTFTGLQKNRFDYLHLQSLVVSQLAVFRANAVSGKSAVIRARDDLLAALEESVRPQLEWRRQYRKWSDNLMATMSVSFILYGRPIARYNPGITPVEQAAQVDRDDASREILSQWQPQAWLDQSLLPSERRVPVDYVACSRSLYAILPELYDSRVLGFDILRFPGKWNAEGKTEYIMFASEKQIVILDFHAIEVTSLPEVLELLRHVLESEHILKVGFHHHISLMFLWSLNVINLNSYWSLPSESLNDFKGHHITGTYELAKLKHLRNNDPQMFFYELASRPYAALRAFHSCQSQDVIRSLPHGNWFDVSSARADLAESIRRGNADRHLGPVNIDRMPKYAFGKKAGSARPFLTASRGAWLKSMSLTMASNLLDRHRNVEHLSAPAPGAMTRDSSQSHFRLALAAYHMAGVFNEDLQTIAHSLDIYPSGGEDNRHFTGVERCAGLILWAADMAQLPINDKDRDMLVRRSQGWLPKYL